MRRVVDRHFEQSYGSDLAGAPYLMRLQVRRHLADFLTDYQLPILRALEEKRSELTILGLEKTTRIDWVYGGRTFKLAARTDRIERRGGDLYVLDYKTGSPRKPSAHKLRKLVPSDRGSWSRMIDSLQLPFYNLVLAHAHALPRDRVRCRLALIGKSWLDPRIEVSAYEEDNPEQFERQMEALEAVIGGLLAEIIDPDVPFRPCDPPGEPCERCLYAAICDRKA